MKLSWIPRMAAGAPALVGLAASFGQPGFAYAPRIPPIPAPVHDYSLSVEPRSLRLDGPRSVARLLVTLNRTDGATLDISDRVRYAVVGPPVVEVGKDRILRPKRNGSARIKAVYNGLAAEIPITVRDAATSTPVSFRNEVIPILTRAGCNQGACHGSQYGKGGFKLSLAGFDPDSDFVQIARRGGSRRVDVVDPARSLFLRKPLMQLAHGGGRRLEAESADYRALVQWIAEGARPPNPKDPEVMSLEVSPVERIMREAQPPQRLIVRATYSDGSVRDVTDRTRLASLNEGIAKSTSDGVVTPVGRGQTGITARYAGKVAVSTIIIPYAETQKTKNEKRNNIDGYVETKQRQLGLTPSAICDDRTFIRRVSFDLIGAPPTLSEIDTFMKDRSPDKRVKLVDSLLSRPEYADFWALKWGDLLRVNRVSLTPKGAYVFAEWIHDQFRLNRPADQFVRDLILARGSAFTTGPVNFYRTASSPQDWGEAAGQVFLGVRLQCAKCHNHPSERWSRDDYYRFSAFFARITVKGLDEVGVFGSEQAVRLNHGGEVYHPRTGTVVPPAPLGFPPIADSDARGDRRLHLAEWLTGKGSRMFARNLANRYWGYLFGKGIVNPVDDLRATNPPTNPELLEYLTDELINGGYDLKRLIRLICSSQAYQRSAEATKGNRQDEHFFTRYYPKRLPAESLLDAIDFACGTREKYPELPLGTRAVQISDPGVAVEFLDIFGRPARVVSCECERVAEPNLSQTLRLMNGEMINRKVSQKEGRVAALIAAKKSDSEVLDELYLVTVGRTPRQYERAAVTTLLKPPADRKTVFEDVLLTLLNSKEFLFNH